MAIPKGYKQTEVGVIPEDWQVQPIKYLAPLQRGFDLPNSKLKNGDYPVVYSNGVMNFHDKYMLNGEGVITGRSGTIGKVHYINGKYWPHNTTLWVTSFKNSVPLYVFYLYKHIGLERFLSGSGVPTLNRNNVHDFRIAIPPTKKEQTAIATTLSDVDALITSLSALIEKKRQIKTATMQRLLTGKQRLPGFGEGKGMQQTELGEIPEDWEVVTVFEAADNDKKLFNDGDWVEAEHITGKGVRLVQTGNIGIGKFLERAAKKYIYESSFVQLKCKELCEGDILICRLADPAGRACIFPNIVDDKVITSVDVTIFRPNTNRVDRVYLVNFFSSELWFKFINLNVGGTTHQRISRGALGNILIPFPPVKEQTAIAKILSDMDDDIATLETRLSKTEALKQGMMQELLTGKTRLIQSETH